MAVGAAREVDGRGRSRRVAPAAIASIFLLLLLFAGTASAADPVIAQADRARRVAGVGPSFPIIGYDDLTVAQERRASYCNPSRAPRKPPVGEP